LPLVVDDHHLVDLLAEVTGGWLKSELERSAIYTTSAWYYRVASAAHRGFGSGSITRRLAALPEHLRFERVDELPDWIGLLGPRLIVPVMAALDTRRRPNLLTAEALAGALVTDGTLVVSTDAPLLREGASDLGIGYRVVQGG
jgi:hypothetical protein